MSSPVNEENIIYISAKKNIIFFLNICKAYLENHSKIQLKACGSAMSTAMIIVEMLKSNGYISNAFYETETIQTDVKQKTQLNIEIEKSNEGIKGEVEEEEEESAEDAPEEKKEQPEKIYISLSKTISFFIKLINSHLEDNSCEIFGTGRCISNIIILYEHYRNQPHIQVGHLKTCSKPHFSHGKNRNKTECSVVISNR